MLTRQRAGDLVATSGASAATSAGRPPFDVPTYLDTIGDGGSCAGTEIIEADSASSSSSRSSFRLRVDVGLGRGMALHEGQRDATSMTGPPTDRDLDLRGLKCPMPVLRTRRALVDPSRPELGSTSCAPIRWP